ncbi:MAG: nicotinate phosphoribosyltransferase [Acidobacteria bacterium]|nr:nicotinate phosphoribosyltransferase [Acidobacteriota bacterium]
MAHSYWRLGMNEPATFDLLVRESPANRRFLVAAGLEQALAALEALRFDAGARDYLRSLGRFDPEFVEWLGRLRFTGEAHAALEGELLLPGEPLLEITAPLIQAQLAETILLNTLTFQSAVASKAARVAIAAAGRPVVDFSARRDHGTDAALKAARASFIAGCAGTSNLLAGRLFGLPVYGTMAHAFVMAFPSEVEAFRAFAETQPDPPVLLIDTYDTVEGARRAVAAGRELRARGGDLRGVRLDSGDLASLAPKVRAILDEGGFPGATIFASGDLNEWRIASLVASGAPIDAFGVGTELGTSKDSPALGGVYKLVAYAGRPVVKRSPGKATLPGRKQVWRGPGLAGTVALEGEIVPGTEPLLAPVMRQGRAREVPALACARSRCAARVAALPDELRDLAPCPEGSAPAPEVSAGLRAASEAAGSAG